MLTLVIYSLCFLFDFGSDLASLGHIELIVGLLFRLPSATMFID